MYPTFEFQGEGLTEPIRFAFLDFHPPVANNLVAVSPAYRVELHPEGPGTYPPEELIAQGYRGVVISCPHAAAFYFSHGFAIGNFGYLSTPEGDARITFRFDAPLHVVLDEEVQRKRDDGAPAPDSPSFHDPVG